MAVEVPAQRVAPAPRSDPFARGIDAVRIVAYIGPALFGILILSLVPIVYTVYMSFTNRNGPFRLRNYRVTGLENYQRLLGSIDGDFYIVIGRTFLFTIACVAIFFVVGLALALILNNPAIKGK